MYRVKWNVYSAKGERVLGFKERNNKKTLPHRGVRNSNSDQQFEYSDLLAHVHETSGEVQCVPA